jgi:hypothetical protein
VDASTCSVVPGSSRAADDTRRFGRRGSGELANPDVDPISRYGKYKSGTRSNRRIPSHHQLWVSVSRPSGQKLAYPLPVTSFVFLGVFVACCYGLYTGRFPRLGVVGGLLLGAAAMLAAYDGITLAQREYASTHDGRVTPGVVLPRFDPTKGDDKPWVPTRRRRLWRDLRTLTIEGSRLHDVLGRLILTGSPRAWSVEYRYECERPRGCFGRDIVPEALWRRLYPGQAIDVRRPNGEIGSSRLEENPQWERAIADLAIAAALLVAAGAVSGQLKRRHPRYVTAPAVVTAIEPLRTGDDPTWRVKFAYVDANGATYESANEFLVVACEPGDEGLAVFPPGKPDLATFRPLGST